MLSMREASSESWLELPKCIPNSTWWTYSKFESTLLYNIGIVLSKLCFTKPIESYISVASFNHQHASIRFYIIAQVILAFWLVLAYDLLEDRRIDNEAALRVPLFYSYHILTSSVIYYWTDAQQHGIYLLNEASWWHNYSTWLKLRNTPHL
mgnify:CR=1 FL=1